MSLRLLARSILGTTLWPLSKFIIHRIEGDSAFIGMFHYVRSPILPGVSDDLFLSKIIFGQILDFIVEHFHPLEPEEFFERLQNNQLPKRSILLTFDDGSIDNVTIALPELQKRNLKACFFVCPELINNEELPPTQKLVVMFAQAQPGHYKLSYPSQLLTTLELPKEITIDNSQSRVNAYYQIHPLMRKMHSRQQPIFFDYLSDTLKISNSDIRSEFRLATWSELQKLVNAGMYVGNHTLYHSTISADGTTQFKQDVASAFEQLESLRTTSLKLFCFPYGRKEDVTEEAMAILREQNVDFALATQGGIASLKQSHPWNLRRESISYSLSHFKLTPLLAWIKTKRRLWQRPENFIP